MAVTSTLLFLLLASLTKEEIFKKYIEGRTKASHSHMQLTAFKDTWRQVCPRIQVSKPRSDVCHECEVGQKSVAAARGEEDTIAATEALTAHIKRTTEGHKYYNSCVDARMEQELTGHSQLLFPSEPNTIEYYYVQNIAIPHHARDMGHCTS